MQNNNFLLFVRSVLNKLK